MPGFDYIVEGVPTIPVPGSPTLLYDVENNNLYVASGKSDQWFIIGTGQGGLNDSVQNVSTSQDIGFNGAINTFIKSTAGIAGITLTLPSAIGFSGQQVTFKMMDTGPGTVSIIPNPGVITEQFIDGSTSYELTSQYQAVTLESDNSNWLVRSTNTVNVADTVLFISTSQAIDFSGSTNLTVQGTTGTGLVVIQLPNAVGNSGRECSVIKIDSGAGVLRLEGDGGQFINNDITYDITNQFQSVILKSNGSNWVITGSAG